LVHRVRYVRKVGVTFHLWPNAALSKIRFDAARLGPQLACDQVSEPIGCGRPGAAVRCPSLLVRNRTLTKTSIDDLRTQQQ